MTGPAEVVAPHRASYAEPIVLRAGEEVAVGRRDDRWPGYLWCTSRDDRSGWVHERFLRTEGSRTVAAADYDAAELSVDVGEVVSVLDEAGGWYRCRRGTDEGWLPAECLRPAASP